MVKTIDFYIRSYTKNKTNWPIHSSVTAYNCLSFSLLAYIASLCWFWSWILTDLNCACAPGGPRLPRCSDLNCRLGWKVLTDSCQAPRWRDLKLLGLIGVSGMVPEMVTGTFGTGGLFLAFSSGVCGKGRRPKDEYFPRVAVRCVSWGCCSVLCCWTLLLCCCPWSNLKPLKFGNSLQACLSQ